jgi:hypothetical protein
MEVNKHAQLAFRQLLHFHDYSLKCCYLWKGNVGLLAEATIQVLPSQAATKVADNNTVWIQHRNHPNSLSRLADKYSSKREQLVDNWFSSRSSPSAIQEPQVSPGWVLAEMSTCCFPLPKVIIGISNPLSDSHRLLI